MIAPIISMPSINLIHQFSCLKIKSSMEVTVVSIKLICAKIDANTIPIPPDNQPLRLNDLQNFNPPNTNKSHKRNIPKKVKEISYG